MGGWSPQPERTSETAAGGVPSARPRRDARGNDARSTRAPLPPTPRTPPPTERRRRGGRFAPRPQGGSHVFQQRFQPPGGPCQRNPGSIRKAELRPARTAPGACDEEAAMRGALRKVNPVWRGSQGTPRREFRQCSTFKFTQLSRCRGEKDPTRTQNVSNRRLNTHASTAPSPRGKAGNTPGAASPSRGNDGGRWGPGSTVIAALNFLQPQAVVWKTDAVDGEAARAQRAARPRLLPGSSPSAPGLGRTPPCAAAGDNVTRSVVRVRRGDARGPVGRHATTAVTVRGARGGADAPPPPTPG